MGGGDDGDADEDDDDPEELGNFDDSSSESEPRDTGEPSAAKDCAKKAGTKAQPRPLKSADKMARDARLEANSALYAHLSDEELKKVVPQQADGNFTSIGGILHAAGECAVCIFHHSPKGCYNSIRCKFCHGDHEKPQRKRRKRSVGREEGEDGERAKNANGGAGDAVTRKGRLQKRRRKEGAGRDAADDGIKDVQLDAAGNSMPCWLRHDVDRGRAYAPIYDRWSVTAAHPAHHNPWGFGAPQTSGPAPVHTSVPTPVQHPWGGYPPPSPGYGGFQWP